MNIVKRIFVIALISSVATACVPGERIEETEPGIPSADVQTEPDEVASVALEIGTTTGEAGGAARTLASLFAPVLRDDDTTSTAGETLRSRVEAAVSEGVVEAGCVTFSWVLARATVEFDECQLLETGEHLDGSITASLRLLKRTVIVTVEDLSIGSNTFFGSVTASVRGPLEALTLSVDADVTWVNRSATLLVDDATVRLVDAGLSFSGTGSITSPKVDASVTLDEVLWQRGNCAPTSGVVAYEVGPLRGSITFLESTPDTGEVLLRQPPLPAAPLSLFPGCE